MMKMKFTASFILLVLFASGFCEDTTPTTNPTTESTTPSTQTDTTETTSITSTVLPSTTTIATTSSSEPPTTTTTTTEATTTDKPTTTPVPETTTTPSPTTVPPSTTTKSPEPPTPVEGSWNVTEGNVTCIRADLKIRFEIALKDRIHYIVLSPNATSSGNCELTNDTQELQLEESDYTLVMIFEKNSGNAYLRNVTFSYTLPEGSGVAHNDTKLFSVKLGNSYMCDSSSNIYMKNVTMEFYRMHIQAFGNKDFGTAEECEADNKVNDMVPIAVGIALLCLVVVVLIAYFVGRRRSRQKGYQSV